MAKRSKQKFYAVRRGLVPGVYRSWAECQENVNGFPGAIFKSFDTEEEALAFVSGEDSPSGMFYAVRGGRNAGIYRSWEACQEAMQAGGSSRCRKFPTEEEAAAYLRGVDVSVRKAAAAVSASCPVAFTDGSFQEGVPRYGYGAVILYEDADGVHEEELSGSGSNPAYLGSRNIPGETLAVLKTIEWAVEHGYPEIEIHYDYSGLGKCADNSWQPKKPVLVDYVEALRKLEERIRIRFVKVKGHSNNTYNDRADALAAAGLGAEET